MIVLSQCLFFIEVFALFLGLGLLVANASVLGALPGRGSLLLPLGITLSVMISNLGYRWGLATRSLCFLLVLLATAGFGRFLFRCFANPRERIKPDRVSLLVLLVAALLLLMPALFGGLQFTLFRGNHTDSFNYLESSATYAHFSFKDVWTLPPLDLEAHGGFSYARENLLKRPSVSILYATLSWLQPSNFVGNHYLFLLVFQYASLFVAASLAGVLATRMSERWRLLLAAVVFCGFWGQYALDLDAWSQVAAGAPMLGAVLFFLRRPPAGEERALSYYIYGYLVLAGAAYLYPEGACLLALPLALVLTLELLRRRELPLLRFHLVGAAILVLALSPVFDSNVKFLFGQSRQANAGYDWWRYYQAFFGGLDGFDGWSTASLVDGFAGLFGLYFLTPAPGLPVFTELAQRAFLFGVLVFAFAYAVRCWVRAWRESTEADLLAPLVVALILMVELLWFFFHQSYWTAGKGFSILAPLFALLLFAPGWSVPAEQKCGLWGRLGALALLIVMGGQAFFALQRIKGAGEPSGIHFPSPYPAVMDSKLKEQFRYDELGFLEDIRRSDLVSVRLMEAEACDLVRLELLAHNIPYINEGVLRLPAGSDMNDAAKAVDKRATLWLVKKEEGARSRIVSTRVIP